MMKNLQNIVVFVREMSIDTVYDFNTHADRETAKVVLDLEKGQPHLAHLAAYITLLPGVPNPFTLGQRLRIAIDAEHAPAAHEQGVPIRVEIGDEARDEAIGLGVQFDRDVVLGPNDDLGPTVSAVVG